MSHSEPVTCASPRPPPRRFLAPGPPACGPPWARPGSARPRLRPPPAPPAPGSARPRLRPAPAPPAPGSARPRLRPPPAPPAPGDPTAAPTPDSPAAAPQLCRRECFDGVPVFRCIVVSGESYRAIGPELARGFMLLLRPARVHTGQRRANSAGSTRSRCAPPAGPPGLIFPGYRPAEVPSRLLVCHTHSAGCDLPAFSLMPIRTGRAFYLACLNSSFPERKYRNDNFR